MIKFTVQDITKFCSIALSDEQQAQWVDTANEMFDRLEVLGASGSEERAVLKANSMFSEMGEVTVPAAALMFSDKEIALKFTQEDGADEKVQLDMVGYSGGIIKDHWWWDDLAIDLDGVSFTAEKFPILENHDTDRKIAFTGKPNVTEQGIVADPDTTVFLDNDVSRDFVSNSKKGFPYQSSVYVQPMSIERVEKDAEVEVNGFTLKGPGTVFRKCEFKEMSACVFGWDSNTNATAFNKGIVLGKGCEVGKKFSETVSDGDHHSQTNTNSSLEESVMDLTKFKEEHPDLYKEVHEQGVEDGKSAAELTFASERDATAETVATLSASVSKFEKAEVIRSEKEIRRDADMLFSAKLAKSDVPEHLHAKVTPHVAYAQFVADGVLDTEKFSEAIDAEIKSWTDAGVSTQIMGNSFSSTSVIETAEAAAVQLAAKVDADVERLLGVVQAAK
ncbi:MAG: hypothetical protein KAH38_08440 [Candidatus Hydrogenedentes bacterium]|nr:hypothetical protein [Candidatus Hydrogenedentota bacterium]